MWRLTASVLFVPLPAAMTVAPHDKPDALAMLEQAHSFPCVFVFKAIGANEPAFPAALAQAALIVLGPKIKPEVRLRESQQGRHVAVTLSLPVQSAQQVLDVYAALGGVPRLHMLL